MIGFLEFLETNRTAIATGFLLFFLAWESIAPCFPFFRQRKKARFLHALLNFVLFTVNAIVVAVVFIGLWGWASDFARARDLGVVQWIPELWWVFFEGNDPAEKALFLVQAVTAILLLDLWTYWWHRMNHRIPFLWQFHRVHHSDPEMDVTTANRFHFGEMILSSLLRVPIIILVGADLWHLAVYEAIMFPVVQFHHANIRLPDGIDRALRWLIPTPVMHKIHHSAWRPETDSNYTSLLSIWDRLFGSYRGEIRDWKKLQLGLKEFSSERDQSLWALLKWHRRK